MDRIQNPLVSEPLDESAELAVQNQSGSRKEVPPSPRALNTGSIDNTGSIVFAANQPSEAATTFIKDPTKLLPEEAESHSFATGLSGAENAEAWRRAKEQLNREGQGALRSVTAAIESHRVIGIGEDHTYKEGYSAHIKFFTEHMKELAKAGVTDLMVELPMVAQPVLDAFNSDPARGDLKIPDQIVGPDGKAIDTPEAKGALEILRGFPPHYKAMWKAARDAGISLHAVDNNANALVPHYMDSWKGIEFQLTEAEMRQMSDPKNRERMLARDADMAKNIQAVLEQPSPDGRERKGLAWLGSLHVADTHEEPQKSKRAFQMLRESLGSGQVTSFFSQLGEAPATQSGPYPLALQVEAPVAVSTGAHGAGDAIGNLALYPKQDKVYPGQIYGLKQSKLHDWGHVLFYPPTR